MFKLSNKNWSHPAPFQESVRFILCLKENGSLYFGNMWELNATTRMESTRGGARWSARGVETTGHFSVILYWGKKQKKKNWVEQLGEVCN